jgi:bacillithiol biosynthesis cysteine-adding enzyme BshC
VGRAFSTSYLAGEPAARELFPRDFRERAQRVTRAREAAQRPLDPSLIAVLREQQSRLPPSAARQANLEALAAGGAAVVVTGQQVGLFLGPLYTLYKAASAVAVARAVEAESGIRCLPLFWLQTEDHDFAEIATCAVAGRDGQPVRLTLGDERADAEARVSVAHRVLGDDVGALIDRLADGLPPGPAADQLLALLRLHYAPGRSLVAAFAGTLATVFADEGLLFLDPRDARVAALAAPLYRAAIESAEAIDGRLRERGAWLAAAGFDEQVSVRPGCPLVFFHPQGPTGPRFRLQRGQPAGGGWTLAGGSQVIAHDELLAALARQPLCFSTSALLRPIVQDALLPALAYVAGPGEINYFAQLGPIYELLRVSPALVVPRARFRCLDPRTQRRLAALGLEPGDLGLPAAELRARLPIARGAGAPDPAELRRRVAERITPVVEQMAREVAALGPQLARPAQRARDSVAHAHGRLIDRAAAALAERDQVTTRRLLQLRAELYPEGVAQERFYGWPFLAGRYGPLTFKQLVLEQLRATGPFLVGERELRP